MEFDLYRFATIYDGAFCYDHPSIFELRRRRYREINLACHKYQRFLPVNF